MIYNNVRTPRRLFWEWDVGWLYRRVAILYLILRSQNVNPSLLLLTWLTLMTLNKVTYTIDYLRSFDLTFDILLLDAVKRFLLHWFVCLPSVITPEFFFVYCSWCMVVYLLAREYTDIANITFRTAFTYLPTVPAYEVGGRGQSNKVTPTERYRPSGRPTC